MCLIQSTILIKLVFCDEAQLQFRFVNIQDTGNSFIYTIQYNKRHWLFHRQTQNRDHSLRETNHSISLCESFIDTQCIYIPNADGSDALAEVSEIHSLFPSHIRVHIGY